MPNAIAEDDVSRISSAYELAGNGKVVRRSSFTPVA